MKKIHHFIKTRKILSGIIIILIILAGYWAYGKITSTAGESSYILGKAQIKDIITTVTGTGQISASSQVDLKSKVSGDLVYLNTKANGTQVKKGDLIAQVDSTNALISLESAKIAYEKLVAPADAPTLLQSQNSLSSAVTANKKSYDDGFNSVVSAFTDIPTIMSNFNDMLYSRTGYLQTENIRSVGQSALDLQNKAGVSFDKANAEYNSLLVQYKSISRTDTSSTIETLVSNTYNLTKDISEAIKDAQNTADYVRTQRNDSAGTTAISTIASWTNTMNADVANLLSAKNTITSSINDVAQNTANLHKLQQGATDLDIAAQQLNLQQAENSYADYFIRAPFDGVLARLSVKSTDTVSGSTVIGTIVSPQQVADITLNEVDAEKVHVGQNVTLTFDAVDGLSINGTVTTVDLVGTVTQGVVNYNIEITLNSQDDRVKSGMSVSASIVVDTKSGVLTVPNSAIKTQGKMSYVQVFNPPLITTTKSLTAIPSKVAPTQKVVQLGVSNDSLTEITSGLNEGDQIVIRTIAGTTASTATAPSLLSAVGAGGRGGYGGGGGGTRTTGTTGGSTASSATRTTTSSATSAK